MFFKRVQHGTKRRGLKKNNIIHFQLYDKLVDVEKKVESVSEKLNLLPDEKDDETLTMTRYR